MQKLSPAPKSYPENDIVNLLERFPSAKNLGHYHEVQSDVQSKQGLEWPLLLEIQACPELPGRPYRQKAA